MDWKHTTTLLVVLAMFTNQGHSQETASKPRASEDQYEISVANHPSIQAAIDANPGKMIYVPQGNYRIDQPLNITTSGTGLHGYGVIVQENSSVPILRVHRADDVRIISLTFRRTGYQAMDRANGIVVDHASNVLLERIRVHDHKVAGNAIWIRNSSNCTVRDSEVINYKQVAVDDRTNNALQGYAFRCIDGTGINVYRSTGTVISGNRVVEHDILPTKETVEKYDLGKLVPGRLPSKPGELGKRAINNGTYVDFWHQGSAIMVGSPTETRRTLITNNYIENASQGIDLHCDNVICSGNTVTDAGIGLKAMHGSRNLILSGNLLTNIDRWGIVINPGAGSTRAQSASSSQPAKPANVDGGTIISNNVITNYGMGHEYWHLGGAHTDRGSSYGIALLAPQLSSNPPLRDVLIQGNIVYDSSRDAAPPAEGEPSRRPKYRFAVLVEKEKGKPEPIGIHFSNNVFHPGTEGISNIKLQP